MRTCVKLRTKPVFVLASSIMKNGKRQDWRRPGVRVNFYFDSRDTLRKLDRLARRAKITRSKFVAGLVAEKVGA